MPSRTSGPRGECGGKEEAMTMGVRETQGAPAAPLTRRGFRGVHVIAMGVGILVVLLAAIWRCG
jgi:hypothetical protein